MFQVPCMHKIENQMLIDKNEQLALHFLHKIQHDENYEFSVSGQEVKAIDTNGAGDMFAGAVLNGLNNQKNLEESLCE